MISPNFGVPSRFQLSEKNSGGIASTTTISGVTIRRSPASVRDTIHAKTTASDVAPMPVATASHSELPSVEYARGSENAWRNPSALHSPGSPGAAVRNAPYTIMMIGRT